MEIRKTEIDSGAMKLISEILHQNSLILSLLCNPPMILEPPEVSNLSSETPFLVPERPLEA